MRSLSLARSAKSHRRRATPRTHLCSHGAPEKSRFYWSTCPGEAIGEEVFGKCLHILLSPKEFDAHQHTLAAVNSSISESHWGNWNERALTKKGFRVIDQPAIVAVAEPDGRFAIQFVLLPKMPCQHAMANLANRVFDECGRPTARKTRGQTNVKVMISGFLAPC